MDSRWAKYGVLAFIGTDAVSDTDTDTDADTDTSIDASVTPGTWSDLT